MEHSTYWFIISRSSIQHIQYIDQTLVAEDCSLLVLKEKFRILIVGGGIAGFSAALRASDSCDSIGILSEESNTYRRAALNSVVYGCINTESDIEIFPRKEIQERGIHVYNNCKALSLKLDDRIVLAETQTNKRILQYEKLVLATGSTPVTPRIENASLERVYRIKWFKDAKALSSQARIGRKAVVIGAGLAGIEMAEALAIKGLKVTIAEKCGSILPQILEPDFAEKVTEQIRKKKVEVRLNSTISSIGGKEKVNHVIVDGEEMETDVLVFATGFKPNTGLLRDSGIQLSDNMAIKTDEHMETNIDGVYAAGDCAETLDLITGQNTYRPLGTVAARAGEIAGLNAGGKSSSYGGFIRRQYDRIFGVDIVSMGLTRSLASNLGIRTYDIDVHEKRHSDSVLFRTQKMKAIVNEETDAIVGFQAIGSTKYRSWYSLQIQECILKKVKIDALSHMGVKLRPFMN